MRSPLCRGSPRCMPAALSEAARCIPGPQEQGHPHLRFGSGGKTESTRHPHRPARGWGRDGSAGDDAADADPPVGPDASQVDHAELGDVVDGHTDAVDGVDAPVDEQIAAHAEREHQVDADIRQVVLAREGVIHASKCGDQQTAGREKNEAAMELGRFAPIDGEHHAEAEDTDVEEGDGEKGVAVRHVEAVGFKVDHADGGHHSKGHHDGGDRGGHPADGAMPFHVAGAHQGRLQNKDQDPGREGDGMDPEDAGRGDVGMEQPVVDGLAEAGHHGRGRHERHGEVEVAVEEAVAAGEYARTRRGNGRRNGRRHGL
jgi:hypothetical protein